jgi:glycyl-tRNA synthetase alpha chain
MYLQDKENVFDLLWNDSVSYGDVHKKGEWELSTYNFELADVEMLLKTFDMYEQEAKRISEKGLVLPAYDYCLKCSHIFNIMDARGAISVSERTHHIDRIRNLARLASKNYLAQREEMGYPLMGK